MYGCDLLECLGFSSWGWPEEWEDEQTGIGIMVWLVTQQQFP